MSEPAAPEVGALFIATQRGGVEINWETGDYVGPVIIKAVNADNGDVGIVKDQNDGSAFLTWPAGNYEDSVSVFKDVGPDVEPDAADLIAFGKINVSVKEQ